MKLPRPLSNGARTAFPAARLVFVLASLALWLVSCRGILPQPTATPSPLPSATPPPPTTTHTPLPSPTWTAQPSPTATYTVTPTPTPLLLAAAGTPLPGNLASITYRSAGQVSALAEWKQESLTDLAWTPDGKLLAASGFEGLWLYDSALQQAPRQLETDTGIVSIDFHPGGEFLAAGYRSGSEVEGYGGSVEFWRTAGWEAMGTFFSENQAVSAVRYAPDGRSFAAAFTSPTAADNRLLVWDTFTWEISRTLRTGAVLALDYSPVGQQIATTPDRFAIKIWSLKDGTLLRTMPTSFTGAVNCIVYSPNGAWIATGHYDGSLRIWDTEKGTLLHTLQAEGVVESLAFNPDGLLLAAGYSYTDNTVRLWDAETGLLLRTLEGHKAGVESLDFSPDGTLLASGTYDGVVRLWGLRP